jgi:hypothetical protein
MWTIALLGGVVIVLISYVALRSRYYRTVFSEGNFREFHQKLAAAISRAMCKPSHDQPSPNDGTGFATRAGLAVAVTCNSQDGRQTLHVSLSQIGQITTHAVCSRFGFFTTVMFESLNVELSPYYTDSGVHHLVFRFPTFPSLQFHDFDTAFARYLKDYKPLPFRHEPTKAV